MKSVNERSAAVLEAEFRDPNNRLQAPTALTYRIDDLATGTQIRPWTALDPAPSVKVVLTSSDQRVLDQGGTQQLRIVTFVAAYGSGSEDQATGDMVYAVNKLRKLN